jgi:diguanylate cyclase (GGDEF)-like protein
MPRVAPFASPVDAAVSRDRMKARSVWTAYAGLGVVLVAYLVSLLLRRPDQMSTLVDGWLVVVFELVAVSLAFGRVLVQRAGRAVPLALGGALLMWTFGDAALTWKTHGDVPPPTPSLPDYFYLGFYPLAYLALVLLFRGEASRLVPATWLDGGVAGLGVAALFAAFAFQSLEQHVGGGTASVATNLAYPAGDVLLLALVVGGSAVQSGRANGRWLMVAGGCALNAVGDTVNLFPSLDATKAGTIIDAIAWPTAILLMSSAMWLRPRPKDLLVHERAPGFLLPGLGAACGLGILAVGAISHVEIVAVALGTGTLVIVGARLALSVWSLRALTEERHRQAITDELTGLGNRRRLTSILDAFFADHIDAATEARQLAFLYVDLNRFKEINDSFGHAAGDQLLTQLGPRLTSCLGSADVLLRIGGDEFAAVLVDADGERATRVAERLTVELEAPFDLDMVSVHLGASVGIALAPNHATGAEALMRCADEAMYRAKQTGARSALYDRAVDDQGDRRRLVEDLRVAIDERALEVHYQPQFDLRSGTITAVEALLRWPHPRLGAVPPLEFLPLAEQGGLMRPLTAFVLDEALTQCATWRAAGNALTVSVNVSATNILDFGFSDQVRVQLKRHRFPADALTLEITETTAISDFKRCQEVIAQLRELGSVISIDDFGAGFTSLSYLGRLGAGELKLDRTFLTDVHQESPQRDTALIGATIDLAHALGLRVVAEGVEDRATLELLRRLNCDLAQGYAICRPVAATGLAFDTIIAA